ncbi:MAG: radical SAM protein [Chloroflexi bacterium]|nr:MAG: radical SAM protein [Chloroflexota bacterium]
MSYQRVFGPVPSRRLGRSLGINNIPPKICTYACVYCQLGNAIGMTDQRKEFFDPADLVGEVAKKVKELNASQESIDYLTIVPDGEPTLDLNLGRLLNLLKPLGIKLAVISNASLIGLPEVKDDLLNADWVSLKVDSTQQDTWKAVDRPHGKIKLSQILEGIQEFARGFTGELVSETMLVQGVNDGEENIKAVASYLKGVEPTRAYLGIPTRPPAENFVSPPTEENLNQAFQIFLEAGLHAEYLIGYEGNEFSSTDDIETDLLSITSVHPMREDAVSALLARAGEDFKIVDKLIKEGKLASSAYRGNTYYIRKFTRS